MSPIFFNTFKILWVETNSKLFEILFKAITIAPLLICFLSTNSISGFILLDKEVRLIELDPFMETADTDRSNNFWPPKMEPSKFELYKYKNRRSRPSENPMKKKK